MTTSPISSEHDLTPEQAIREHAWQNALHLYSQWQQAETRATGGAGGGGYRDPHAAGEWQRLRTLLDETVREHGFENTRVDPIGLSWFERQQAPFTCPTDESPKCSHDSLTCDVHWARRYAMLPSYDCDRNTL